MLFRSLFSTGGRRLSGVLRGEGASQTFTIAVPEETSTQLQAKQSKQPVPPSELMKPNTVDEKELKEKRSQRWLTSESCSCDYGSRSQSPEERRPAATQTFLGRCWLVFVVYFSTAQARCLSDWFGPVPFRTAAAERSRNQHFASKQALCRGTSPRQR